MRDDEVRRLQAEVAGLREKVRSLRVSRQVLMSLLSTLERERRARISRLQMENSRLQRANVRFARAVLERNARICRLEAELLRAEAAAGRGGSPTA